MNFNFFAFLAGSVFFTAFFCFDGGILGLARVVTFSLVLVSTSMLNAS
jgi:hypothetical protein